MISPLRIYQPGATTLTLVDEITFYQSANFTRSRSGIGSFSITIALDAPKTDSFVKYRLVQFGDDLRRIGVITRINRSFDESGNKTMMVTGVEAKGYARWRSILPPTGSAYYVLTDDAETCIKNLLTDSIGSGAATKRKLNFVNVTASGGTGATYRLSSRYENLAKILQEIAESANMGWDFRLNTSTAKLDVTTYLGTDRRSTQSVNPRAIFSTEWKSLASADVEDSIDDYVNLAIVAGQGEGADRTVRTVYTGTEPEADQRIETFIDARDLATTGDLDARGAEVLVENGYSLGLEADAIQTGLTFGTDYDVGDRVTISAFGVESHPYITAVTERWGADGYKVALQFDKPTATASQALASDIGQVKQTLTKIEDVTDIRSDLDRAGLGLYNLGISASVGSNALTIRLRQADGTTDPGAGKAGVGISFRSTTASTGARARVDCTSALSIVVSSGSTLGSFSTYANRVYVYAILYNGAIELAVSGSPYNDGELVTTTVEGGAGAADSKFVMYSATARTNVPCRLIGRVTSTQTTAGTWATSPSLIEVMPFDPTERGQNANGYYEQRQDGVMIQWGSAVSGNISTSTSNYYGSTSGTSYFANLTVTWPLTFINAPSVTAMTQSPTDTTTQVRTAATTTSIEFRLVNGSSVGAGTVRWAAIDYWR